jgi:amidase
MVAASVTFGLAGTVLRFEGGPVGGYEWATALEIAEAVRGRQVSAAEVLAGQLERIERLDAELGAVVTLDPEGARARAEEADKALARGEVWGPLHGVGITIEDAHATAGMRSTFGGYRPFADCVPAADATVVSRLKAAGAIVVGKTNGPCIWGDDSVFPLTKNPWNRARTPGGSSTGPAVALAAGLTPLDIGTDSAGSIQEPAAYCGVLGMRPTEHRVPLTGTLFVDPVRKFRVLTTAGPMARSVADLRLAMRLISGPDGRDPEVPPLPWRDARPARLAGLRVAYAPGFPPAVDPEIRAGADAFASELAKLGVIVEDRLPDPALAWQRPLVDKLFAMIVAAENAAPGPDMPSSPPLWDYLAVLDRRDQYMASWHQFFGTCDLFLAPAMPDRAGPADAESYDGSPMAPAMSALLLSQASGCPMVVLPAGTDSNGVPYAVQLVAPRWHDERLLDIAEAITAATGGFRPPPGL